MSEVDINAIRKGDRVAIWGDVIDINPLQVVVANQNGWIMQPSASEVAGHERRELKVGDLVRTANGKTGRIVAMDGDNVWIYLNLDNKHITWSRAEAEFSRI